MSALDRTPLQNAFYWLGSYRGDNNFFGRILNSCRRNYTVLKAPAGIAIDNAGRFCLHVDLKKFNAQPVPLQLCILVHEAAHLGFRHHERMLRTIGGARVLSANPKLRKIWETLNIAADLTANDLAVRPLTVGKNVEAFKVVYEKALFPEKCNLPQGLSMEEYFLLLMERENAIAEILKKIKENEMMLNMNCFGDPDDEPEEDQDPGDNEDPEREEDPEDNEDPEDDENDEGDDEDPEDDDYEDEDDNDYGDDEDPEGEEDPEDDEDCGGFDPLFPRDTEKALGKILNMSGGELERLANDIQRNAASAVRTAVEQTTRNRGTIPGCMQKIVEELLTEPKVPWPIVLRNQIKSVISNKLIYSMNQPNIALYPVLDEGIEPFPGYNHDFTFRITLATDSSGSMSDDNFAICINEHIAILRQFQGVMLRAITFDHGIQYEELFTRTSSDSEIQEIAKTLRIRHGYGGTDFCAPFRRVLGKDTAKDWSVPRPDTQPFATDLMVIFTDGEAPVSDIQGGPMPRLKPPCPVIWVICPKGSVHPAMQDIVVKIDD